MSTNNEKRCMRLVGEIDGCCMIFDLVKGEYRVGLNESNDIVIPMAGVSRKHAVVRSGIGQIEVEDVGSKNGTYLNGAKVKRAVVRPGEWIGFGPAVFLLSEVDRKDAELAISMEGGVLGTNNEASPLEHDTDTRAGNQGRESRQWLNVLNKVAGFLIGAYDPDVELALKTLRMGLDARGACLYQWSGDEDPIVLCASGDPFHFPDDGALRIAMRAVAEVGESEATMLSGAKGQGESIAWAVTATPGKTPYGIVLLGGFQPARAMGPLLEICLRMFIHSKSELAPLRVSGEKRTFPHLNFSDGYVAGESDSMKVVYDQIRQLLKGNLPVLITGETGVGKEFVARLLHASSDRSDGPFVAVNCAAIPSELLEAELFGIERGVATGVEARKGKFQLAEGGVLFLDEIGDMSTDLQAKLLRVLQEMEITPVGGRWPLDVDVRVISATNTDLERRLASGTFRRDLYFRLAGFILPIPPLRERREDIPALVEHFLRRCARELCKSIRGLTVKTLEALVSAPWPGNVRELEHEVRRLVYLCPEGQAISSRLLSHFVLFPDEASMLDQPDPGGNLVLETRLSELERKLITIALARTKGNRSKAAKLLGISRNGLAMKMKRLELE
ncbi:MAG: FHA domain-containing protein [Acidobacteria bacterium]|nr:FHA domain-containing protein [Acidobacteriota bacterium]